jgi:hypothetical protein
MDYDSRDGSLIGPDGSPPSEAWLFAQIILGKPIPRIVSPETAARLKRQELESLAEFSPRHAEELRKLDAAEAETRHDREQLEWTAGISTRAEDQLRKLQRQEAEEREAWRRAEQFAEQLLEGNWDPSQHPRAPQGQPDGGQWVAKGGGSSAGSAFIPSSPIRTAAFHPAQAIAHLVALGGAQSSTWPTTGSASSWLPKVGSGAGAGAGAAVGIGAGGFFGALRNGSLGMYWARMPGVQAMPQIWVYELEKRVRAGTLSRDDAIGIFNTAVLGAEAQSFKPTGGTMSAVHKSAVDFLGQAEAVYFAKKKKEQGWAKQPGGYQLSGGRVFPTKRNSGLDGYALRQEQEKFFERGLAEGKLPGQLRGQAAEAGSKRAGGVSSSDDHLIDPEAEAALQRAIRKATK